VKEEPKTAAVPAAIPSAADRPVRKEILTFAAWREHAGRWPAGPPAARRCGSTAPLTCRRKRFHKDDTIRLGVTTSFRTRCPTFFREAIHYWNASTVIESPWSFGSISQRRRCTSATGKIEVCNESYGQTGWLGIAGISLSGGHIVKGYTKLNDTYYATAQYNTPAWRRLVYCQEVGHNYGLAHQNEIFTNVNTGSCMDYTNAPAAGILGGVNYGLSNEYPNAHDYEQLLTIYNHQIRTAKSPSSVLKAPLTHSSSNAQCASPLQRHDTVKRGSRVAGRSDLEYRSHPIRFAGLWQDQRTAP
jgi:hypothetical protein